MEVRDLILPDFAFVEGWGDRNILNGRNVVLHSPSLKCCPKITP